MFVILSGGRKPGVEESPSIEGTTIEGDPSRSQIVQDDRKGCNDYGFFD